MLRGFLALSVSAVTVLFIALLPNVFGQGPAGDSRPLSGEWELTVADGESITGSFAGGSNI